MIQETYKEVVIYLRTSTEEQNPENQLKDCESIRPKDRNYDTFVDYYLMQEQQSAFHDFKDRHVFEKLRMLIKDRKVKTLIVWDLDRIYRNRNKLKEFFVFCDAFDCTILSFRQKFLQDIEKIPEPFNEIMHDLMLNLLGWIAEDESKHKSERVKASIRLNDGETYSYKGNKWGRKPISTFKRNQIVSMYNKGDRLRSIAIELKVSLGAVHKIVQDYKDKKLSNKDTFNKDSINEQSDKMSISHI